MTITSYIYQLEVRFSVVFIFNFLYMLFLKDLQKEILQIKNQITMISICSASEKARIEYSLSHLNEYKKNFDLVFEKGKYIHNLT